MKSMVYCYICEKEFKHMNVFLTHHRWYHDGITTKEYYDKYLKKENEGICLTPDCNKECNFHNLTHGYHKHCSRLCTKKDPEFNNKIIKTKSKTGIYNNNRSKAEETCLTKYGVKNISQVDEIQKKKEETCLKNNGYKYYTGSKEQKEWMQNGGAAYCNMFIQNPSKPQIELFRLISNVFPYPIMNYPCGKYSIDIAVPNLNLAFEYDGAYWHQNENYDKRRQKYIEKCGWKVLRYLDILPTIQDLKRIT
jgi:hypothetical protein